MSDRSLSLEAALDEFAQRLSDEGRGKDALFVRGAAALLTDALTRPIDVRTVGHADLDAHNALTHIEELCGVLRRRITAARSRAGYNDLLRSDELHAAEMKRVNGG